MSNQPPFLGFSKELPKFLQDLSENNDKVWFDRNRASYESLCLEPSKLFVAALGSVLSGFVPGLRAEPRVNGSIMRINRDTRFSKDKTPYKTALHFIFWQGEGKARGCPAFYVRVAHDSLGLAAGLFMFDAQQLERYRAAVVDENSGKRLLKVVAKVAKPPFQLSDPALKNVPKGYDKDHPRVEFLKYKGLTVGGDLPLPAEMLGSDAVAYCARHLKAMLPLQAWLIDAFQ